MAALTCSRSPPLERADFLGRLLTFRVPAPTGQRAVRINSVGPPRRLQWRRPQCDVRKWHENAVSLEIRQRINGTNHNKHLHTVKYIGNNIEVVADVSYVVSFRYIFPSTDLLEDMCDTIRAWDYA